LWHWPCVGNSRLANTECDSQPRPRCAGHRFPLSPVTLLPAQVLRLAIALLQKSEVASWVPICPAVLERPADRRPQLLEGPVAKRTIHNGRVRYPTSHVLFADVPQRLGRDSAEPSDN